jgi:hypothetical protein
MKIDLTEIIICGCVTTRVDGGICGEESIKIMSS